MFSEPVKKEDQYDQETNDKCIPLVPTFKERYFFFLFHFVFADSKSLRNDCSGTANAKIKVCLQF